MNARIGQYAAAAVMLVSLSAHAVDITVDCAKRYQRIDGIGAHLYNWSGYTTAYYPTTQFLGDYVGDLGNSMVRFELHPNFCTAELPIESMGNYANYTMNLRNSSVDSVLSTLRNIKQRDSTIRVIGTVWAPPAWMKTNNQTCCGGNLRTDRYEHFARYLYQYTRFLEDQYGVKLYALSTQNELFFYEPYNSCIYTAVTYRDMMKVVGAYFASQGSSILLFGPEDMTGSVDRMVGYVDTIMNDATARQYLHVIASHGYSNGVISDGGSPEQNMELYTRLRRHDLPFWMTETSGEDWRWNDGYAFNDNGTPMAGALNGLGKKMHVAFVYGFCGGWTYWAYSDAASSGAYGFGPNSADKKYAVHKHYSRFVKPGAWRVAATPDGIEDVSVSAFHDSTRGTLSVVLLNTGSSPRTVNLRVAQGVIVPQLTHYQTTEQESFAIAGILPVGTTDNSTAFTLPARSMATLHGNAAYGTQGTPVAAPSITLSAPSFTYSTIIPATLTITRGFGYYSFDSTNWSTFDLVYDLGSKVVPVTQTSTLYYKAVDGPTSSVVYTQQFTITPEGATPYQQASDGMVRIEAENYFSKAPGTGAYTAYEWQLREGPLYSRVMQALPNDRAVRGSVDVGTAGAALNYQVTFARTGTHYVWMRGTGPSASDHWYNSVISYGINGAATGNAKFALELGTGIYENKLRYDYMQWQRGTITVPSAGTHTVSLWMRADGFKIDKFEICTDATYTPPGYVATPLSPSGIAVSDITTTSMAVRWNATARSYGYRLYYRDVTASEAWSTNNWFGFDSSVTSTVFNRKAYRGDPRDSLHASNTYEFHAVALGPQADSHGSPPGASVPLASGTTLSGGNGGFLGFESAAMGGYPIPSTDTFVTAGYDWAYYRTSSDYESLGGKDTVFDRAAVFYGAGSSVVSIDSIPGGVGSVSFTIGRHGYPTGGQFAVSVNGVEIGRTHTLDYSSYDHYRYYFPGANVTGPVKISINNLTPDNGNDSRGSFDDLAWSGYNGGAPATPVALRTSFGDSGQVIAWNAVSGATGYRVYVQGAYPEQYLPIAGSQIGDTAMIIGDAVIRGPMVCKVTALSENGESPWGDSIVALPTHCGPTATGLYAYYFDGRSLSGPAQERIDTAVNFASFATEPMPGLGTTDFSVVWVGQVTPQFAETYTFFVDADDGMRLWVNGVKLIDEWTSGSRERSGTIALSAGTPYHIILQYFQGGGGGRCRLSWSCASQVKQIIPSARLSTGPSCSPVTHVVPVRSASPRIAAPFIQSGRGWIAFGAPAGTPLRLDIYDISGRLVTRHSSVGGERYVLSTSAVAAGTYLVSLRSGSTRIIRRVTIGR